MGVTLTIKDVRPEVLNRIKARAAANHRSLQGELSAMLEQAARRYTYEQAPSRIERRKLRSMGNSTAIIRQGVMPARIADASVLGAWFFDEPRRDEAGALLKGFELYAPDLMPYELANVAWAKARQMPNASDKIAEALSDAIAFEISTMPVDASDLLRVSRQFGITVHDAAYLCVARGVGCPIVTFDRRLARAATQAGLPQLTS